MTDSISEPRRCASRSSAASDSSACVIWLRDLAHLLQQLHGLPARRFRALLGRSDGLHGITRLLMLGLRLLAEALRLGCGCLEESTIRFALASQSFELLLRLIEFGGAAAARACNSAMRSLFAFWREVARSSSTALWLARVEDSLAAASSS